MGLFLEVKLVGGLGNQIFQYATGRSLCIKNKIPYLLLNAESYKNDPFGRNLGIGNFKIKGRIIESEFVIKALRKETKLNNLISSFHFYNVFEEAGLKLYNFPQKMGLLASVKGYWQSEFYFKNVRKELIGELVPRQLPPLPYWVQEKKTVAVHVRRTDYLIDSRFGFLGEKYYYSSMDLVRKQLGNPLFIFFSDDIDWCKSRFNNNDTIFFEEDGEWSQDYLQLYLMSKCSHQIIANSSFSWWSGWLNANPDKIIIRPVVPFADKNLMYESYYPAEWISVNNLQN